MGGGTPDDEVDRGQAHRGRGQDHGPERSRWIVPHPQAEPRHDGGVGHPVAEVVEGVAEPGRAVVQPGGLAVDAVEHRGQLHQEATDQ
jgi:hypothetical protein